MTYRASAANLGVPSQIKCTRCSTVKNKEAFSAVQQKLLVDKQFRKPFFDAKRHAVVPCISCVGGQVVELYCQICDQVKGKDSFFKTQRRNPDKAMCIKCSMARAQEEPDGVSDEEHSSASDSDDSGGCSYGSDDDDDTVSTVAASTAGLSISDAGTLAGPGSSTMGSTGGVSLGGFSSTTASVRTAGTVNRAPVSTSSGNTNPDASSPRKFVNVRAAPRRVETVAAQKPAASSIDEDEMNYCTDSDDE